MEFFKKRCRDLLGPSQLPKTVDPRFIEMNNDTLIEEDIMDENGEINGKVN